MAEENVANDESVSAEASEQSTDLTITPGDTFSQNRMIDDAGSDDDDNSSTGAQTDDNSTLIEDLQAEVAWLRERTQLIDQFEADPQGVLQGVAERLGMSLAPSQGNNNATQDQANSSPPQSFVDNISRNLPPEMQFMAPSIAQATWIANQETLRPFQQQQENTLRQQSIRERDQIAAEMDASHPEWRQSIGEMEEWHNFVRDAVNGGSMRHPKFGTLQEVLFKLATGNKSAVTTAASRMRDAANNATSTSSNQSPSPVDVQKQIAEAKTPNDKFDIAFRAAMAEHNA